MSLEGRDWKDTMLVNKTDDNDGRETKGPDSTTLPAAGAVSPATGSAGGAGDVIARATTAPVATDVAG